MPRPDFITEEQIIRWSKEIENDKHLPEDLIKSPVVREVCFSGLWLNDELKKLSCPNDLIFRIQYSAGKASFGKDSWTIHQQFLDGYINNNLDFAVDPANLN